MNDSPYRPPVRPGQSGYRPDRVPEELEDPGVVIPPRAEDLGEPPAVTRDREAQVLVRAAASTVTPTLCVLLTRLLVPLPWEYVTAAFAFVAVVSALHYAAELAHEKVPFHGRTLAAAAVGFLAVAVQWAGARLGCDAYLAFALAVPPAVFAWYAVSYYRRMTGRAGLKAGAIGPAALPAAVGALAYAAYLSEVPFGALLALTALPLTSLLSPAVSDHPPVLRRATRPIAHWLTFGFGNFAVPFWPRLPRGLRGVEARWDAFHGAALCHALSVALCLPVPDYPALLDVKVRFGTLSALVTHVLVCLVPLAFLLLYPAVTLFLTFWLFDEGGDQ